MEFSLNLVLIWS